MLATGNRCFSTHRVHIPSILYICKCVLSTGVIRSLSISSTRSTLSMEISVRRKWRNRNESKKGLSLTICIRPTGSRLFLIAVAFIACQMSEVLPFSQMIADNFSLFAGSANILSQWFTCAVRVNCLEFEWHPSVWSLLRIQRIIKMI